MAEIPMPSLSESMTEGKLLRWCVGEGAAVRAGDVIAEVETDKANMEIEAVADGTLTRFRAQPGDTVAVGAPLAEFDPAVGE